MQTVKEGVEALNQAFGEFKTTNDERLAQIENKGSADGLVEEKLSRLDQSINEATEKLQQIDIATKRPTMESGQIAESKNLEHEAAFSGYVRKGDEGALQALEGKSLSAGYDPDGGYLVPDYLSDRIIKDVSDHSAMRRLSQVVSISTDAVEMLIDRKGADAGWVGETDARPETSTPELAKIRIPVHEMYAKPKATQKLLDDSRIDVENWLAGKVAHKMSEMENHAFTHGNGEGKPKGFLDYEIKIGAAAEWGKIQGVKTGKNGAFADANGSDALIDLLNCLKPGYLSGAVWLMSRTAMSEVRKLKDKNGHYLWHNGLDGDFRPRLLGYPVELSDEMPKLNAAAKAYSIAFGNFKEGYQIVDRSGTRVLRDPFSSKPYVEFYTTRRVGGDVVNSDALKVLEFSA